VATSPGRARATATPATVNDALRRFRPTVGPQATRYQKGGGYGGLAQYQNPARNDWNGQAPEYWFSVAVLA